MVTSSTKRKWSDVFNDEERYDKQFIMDLCAAKRRKRKLPLLHDVLIRKTMDLLTSESIIKLESESALENFRKSTSLDSFLSSSSLPQPAVDRLGFKGEEEEKDKTVDQEHLEIPTESELLAMDSDNFEKLMTSIMFETQTPDLLSPLTPMEPSMTSYTDTESTMESSEEQITRDILPCTSVFELDSRNDSTWNNDITTSTSLDSSCDISEDLEGSATLCEDEQKTLANITSMIDRLFD